MKEQFRGKCLTLCNELQLNKWPVIHDQDVSDLPLT